jgi:hypothetical protein
MKFLQLFKETAKSYLTEQEMQEMENAGGEAANQMPETSEEIATALPDEETIDLNEEKYKALLLMIQKALILAFKDDEVKRNQISDLTLKIENTPKEAEKVLIGMLDQSSSSFPESSKI